MILDFSESDKINVFDYNKFTEDSKIIYFILSEIEFEWNYREILSPSYHENL